MDKVFPHRNLYSRYALNSTTRIGMIIPPQGYYLCKLSIYIVGHYYVPFVKVELFIKCNWHNLWCLNLIGCKVDDDKFKKLIEGKKSYPNIAVLELSK